MIISIPGELIAMVTFPGVILHEIAHRFFCDINNVPVYEIRYFKLWNRVAGHVVYKPTNNVKHDFLIAIAPLIVNSLFCMLLTLSIGIRFYFGTDFIFGTGSSVFDNLLEMALIWIGYSIGYNAIPSNQDVARLVDYSESRLSKYLLFIFTKIIGILNTEGIGPILQALYAYGISLILPALLWHYL